MKLSRAYFEISDILNFVLKFPYAALRAIRDRAKDIEAARIRQARELKLRFAKEESNLIVFLVEPFDAIGGGLMSICTILDETAKLHSLHQAKTVLATFPAKYGRLLRFTKFKGPEITFQFEEFLGHFSSIENLQIHIPEYLVKRFVTSLEQKKFSLAAAKNISFNILNQNIHLMPKPQVVQRLKKFAPVTCTTAHSRYCTQAESDRYGITYHHLSAYFNTEYYPKPYAQKENLIAVSPDLHPIKDKVLEKLRRELPELQVHVISGMPYEDYKRLLSRAKWTLTFGEGMDAYYNEGLVSGALPLAVYNAVFFPNSEYADIRTNFKSYEDLAEHITSTLKSLDVPEAFATLHASQMELFNREYSFAAFQGNIKKFYEKRFTFPR